VPNISSKILGKTKNKIVVVKATFEALKSFKRSAVEKANQPKRSAVPMAALAELKK
jgi:ribosomal protein S5